MAATKKTAKAPPKPMYGPAPTPAKNLTRKMSNKRGKNGGK